MVSGNVIAQISVVHVTRGENAMPVFILWAIPAVIVIGGGAYWIAHLH